MPAETPQQRTIVARIAAHESWANTPDRSARTAPARAALLARFELEVDPDGTLPPDERARRADHKRKAYFQRLALRSAQARRSVAEGPPGAALAATSSTRSAHSSGSAGGDL